MNILDRLYLRSRPVPADLTAMFEPMFSQGRDGTGVGLTGYPQFINAETDAQGVRYARLRIGIAPDSHVIIRAPQAKWFAVLAEEAVKAHDALNPVPAAMEAAS